MDNYKSSEICSISFSKFNSARIPLEKKDFCEKILTIMNIDKEGLSEIQQENLVSNYVFLSEFIRNDISEITERINHLKAISTSTSKDDVYKLKKIYHFAEINKSAQDEILNYYNKKFIDYLWENLDNDFVEKSSQGLWKLFFDGRYEYATFRRYFDFYYDFSTEAKVCFFPGVTMLNMLDSVRKFIDLKANSLEKYQSQIANIIKENDVISYLKNKVQNHHVFYKRNEIFSSLILLYNEAKYHSFISLAVLQIEGVFYDGCSILAEQELGKKAGTLIEKAEKLFKNQRVRFLSLYPYFAFDVPDIRNEIAHNGMLKDKNLSITANEIMLDLNSIISFVYCISNDKYITLILIMNKILEMKNPSEDDIIKTLLGELFESYQVSDKKFLDILKNPDRYKEEIDFYKIPDDCTTDVKSLKEITQYLSEKVKCKEFWDCIKEYIKITTTHVKNKPYDLVDFAIHLKNTLIPILPNNSPEKLSCQEVAKILRPYEDADKL